MKKTSNKIVFFGSGPVAAESLRLLQKHCEVEAVITKASTQREMKAAAPAAPLFLANNTAELDTLVTKEKFSSRLGILIDFGIIVSQKVIDAFNLGIINSHFSLLPEWRGADPITFAILSGQKKTGVSLMLIVEAMDEGPLLSIGEYELTGSETGPSLTHELIKLSDALLKDTVPAYLHNEPHPETNVKLSPGDQVRFAQATNRSTKPSYSRKLTKADGILDFTKPAEQLEREIRAFIEWPKSHTEIAGKDVVVLKASVDNTLAGTPGSQFKTKDKKIGIYTGKGALMIEELKPAGKPMMTSEAFLAGYGHILPVKD